MSTARELLVVMADGGRECDCDDGGCIMGSMHTIIRRWDELERLLDEHPHMVVTGITVRESSA